MECRDSGKVVTKSEALTRPMTPTGKRVQTLNPPGSEAGPGTVATLGRAVNDEVDAMGFKWKWNGMVDQANTFSLIGVDHSKSYLRFN